MVFSFYADRIMFRLFLCLLTFLISINVYAQSITLNGKIYSQSVPVEGATVRVGDQSTRTDSDGAFTLIVKSLPQQITVQMLGIRSLVKL